MQKMTSSSVFGCDVCACTTPAESRKTHRVTDVRRCRVTITVSSYYLSRLPTSISNQLPYMSIQSPRTYTETLCWLRSLLKLDVALIQSRWFFYYQSWHNPLYRIDGRDRKIIFQIKIRRKRKIQALGSSSERERRRKLTHTNSQGAKKEVIVVVERAMKKFGRRKTYEKII